MTRAPRDQTVGPWAKEKLETLRAYLHYYTTRLKKQPFELWYIDAFAGPGRSPVRKPKVPLQDHTVEPDLFDDHPDHAPSAVPEETEYVKGSPRVALELTNPFAHYLFIEKAADRLAELNALKAEFPMLDIDIRPGDANAQLTALLARRINWRSENKGVVFLDPFGMHVPWTTIASLAKTRGLEVIVNFPFGMAINRMMLRSGRIRPSWVARLDATFGTHDWHNVVYREEPGLWENSTVKRQDTAERVLEWFSGRLQQTFGFASPAQLIRSTHGNPLYYLIWAGPRAEGLTGAEHILGQKTRAATSSRGRR
ncbi:MAG TPA: three-Cys-motif partner protein TcmP [Caulobacteraceae bacterium]|nr:three-Cys-motif partner protein TcmP [Caulobacteraceae bacterium]